MKNMNNKILVILLSLIIMETLMASENTTPPEHYYLSVKTRDIKSIIGINNAPLIQDNEGEGIITSEPVSTWLTQGENRLTLKLSQLGTDNIKLSPSVEIQLFLHDSASTAPTPKTILAEYYYPPREDKSNDELPISLSLPFNFNTKIGTKLWKEAENLHTISTGDKDEIITLINKLESSLLTKDISSTIDIQKYKIIDDALAEHKTVEQLEKATKKSYQWLNEQSGLAVNKISKKEANFIICCNNQAVHVSRNNGTDAIQLESDDLYFDVSIYVSKINEKWTIVR